MVCIAIKVNIESSHGCVATIRSNIDGILPSKVNIESSHGCVATIRSNIDLYCLLE
jgi:hypothetical protein